MPRGSISRPKSTIVSRGGGSAEMIEGASRAFSAAVATPSVTLHGSFFRDLPAIQIRSSSLSAMPSARREAGEHSGSRRHAGSCSDPSRTGMLLSEALESASDTSMSERRSPSSWPMLNCVWCMPSLMAIDNVDRVTPESAVGRGGSASPNTMAATREATSSPFLPRSAIRAAPCRRSISEGSTVQLSVFGAYCMLATDQTTRILLFARGCSVVGAT